MSRIKEFRSLESLLEERMLRIFSQLKPANSNGKVIIPYYGESNSDLFLTLKSISIDSRLPLEKSLYPKKESLLPQLARIFRSQSAEYQNCTALAFSHEIQIASLAASIALSNHNSSVFEIGCDYGFGSIHYSRIIKERGISSEKPIYNLTSIDSDEERIKHAKRLKSLIEEKGKGFPLAKVSFINADSKSFLNNKCKDNDIVFASISVPYVCKDIFELSRLRKISFLVSYSRDNLKRIKKYMNKWFDFTNYDVYAFQDRDYNKFVSSIGQANRQLFGVLAVHK